MENKTINTVEQQLENLRLAGLFHKWTFWDEFKWRAELVWLGLQGKERI